MEPRTSTPRSRPPLKFANRLYEFTSTPNGRTGTPQASSARKPFSRDDLPSSNLSKSSISAARNIFRASSITNSPARPFSPQLPPSTLRKSFVPVATPNTKRLFRDSTAQPSARGVSKTTSNEPFSMRIPSPPPELTGEALAKEVPDGWDQKGSIYADEYLAHLCPPDFDDLQRRQFFCILDMRRLKYAANEIFVKKDWKLNITNFAKEFEKSRSLIMLHYGLYEYKGVKASAEVTKKWRAANGIPDPDDEAPLDSPLKANGIKTTSLKRKAEEDLPPKETPLSTSSPNKNKRQAPDREEPHVATPSPNKNKRKAYVSEEADENQPTKIQKSTPSATKAVFERIANNKNSSSAAKPSPSKPSPKQPLFGSTLAPNPFPPVAKPVNGGLARSILDGVKPGTPQFPSSSNIFGYLSDAGSAQNSGVDADAESSSDSEPDAEEKDAGQSYEPSVAASGGADTPSAFPGTALFSSKKAPFTSGLATGPSSTSSEARESTPGRSIFDRVTKGSDGQPVRQLGVDHGPAEADDEKQSVPEKQETEPKPAPANNTWTPDTPIKFGTATPKPGLFGATATRSSSIFAAKGNGPTSSIFGGLKQDKPTEPPAPADKPVKSTEADTDKSAGESDKENDSQPAVKNIFGSVPKPPEPAAQLAEPQASSLLQPKAAVNEAKKDADATPKPTSSFPTFAHSAKPEEEKPTASSTTSASSLFGSQSKPGALGSSASASPFQSSTLFGAAKPTQSNQSAASSDAPKAAGLFRTAPSSNAASLFGSQPASNANSPFGSGTTTPKVTEAVPPAAKPSTASIFQFGGSQPAAPKEANAEPNSLFSTPKTPSGPSSVMFGGSPMKQDDPSPSKKQFTGAGSGLAGSRFASFSGPQNPTAPVTQFGGSQPSSGPVMFGSGLSGGSGFTFTAGGDQSIRNPFASGNSVATTAAPATGAFNFSAAPSAPSTANAGSAAPFVFGAGGGSTAASAPAPTSSTPFSFGAGSKPTAPAAPGLASSRFSSGSKNMFAFNGPSGQTGLGNSPAPASMQSQKPLFGGATSAPALNFSAPSPLSQSTGNSLFAPKPNQPASSIFASLQPPPGGASTTGTNSPFNFGGASSLATTPATGTPEPAAEREQQAGGDGDGEETHGQINLTEGGPGEEDEAVVHEVRAKVLKFVPPGQGSDSDEKAKKKSPWTTKGVGPFRLLKHKTTGAVRMLLRAEPRGHVALNRMLLPDMKYKAEEKYVKLTTSNEDGTGLETWMMQVKTKELAQVLAAALEENKSANKK